MLRVQSDTWANTVDRSKQIVGGLLGSRTDAAEPENLKVIAI